MRTVSGPRVSVVVGVDGAGRTHRLGELAADATGPVIRIGPGTSKEDLAAALDAVGLVLVDDAHRLDAAALATLTAAARRGLPMVIARRPTILSAELAELDEAAAAQGRVETLTPLSAAGIEALLGRAAGRLPDAQAVTGALDASAGLPAIAAALAEAPPDTPAPALVARVQRRLATVPGDTAALARILALRLDLDDDVLAGATGMSPDRMAAALRELRDGGLLDPAGERMIPAVAEALIAELAPAERRRLHDAVAGPLADAGRDPIVAATQLRAARARTPLAARAYRAAADRLRFTNPAAAADWYDDAVDAGADPAAVALGRAEADALLGLPVDVTGVPPEPHATARAALVEGAAAAHQGRTARAADALLRTRAPGPVLAVPALMATGRPDDAARAATGAASGAAAPALHRLAEAALAVGAPLRALPLFIEAAEAVEAVPPAVVLPDTPHALGAIVAVTAGDAASAEHLLARALRAGIGGPVAAQRHRLLLAWVRLRAGRHDTAVTELGRLAGTPLPGRENLLASALAAGLARRSGDIARMREAWSAVEPVLARRVVDLFQLEQAEELAVAAARLRQFARVAPVIEALGETIDRLGRPPAWLVSLGWLRLQTAIAGDDAASAAEAAGSIAGAAGVDIAATLGADVGGAGGGRQRAQAAAAVCWADALAGRVDVDAVAAAGDLLAGAGLPWEASRLVGQAAIRTDDPVTARRLLERARDLGEITRAGAADGDDAPATLSEREVDVARLVLQGRTYKEIGAQLYIAPKTVEHHVARIRSKVGAADRAEFLAALRELLQPSG
jgi:DNA-binding CsgD family transcriptional regulator